MDRRWWYRTAWAGGLVVLGAALFQAAEWLAHPSRYVLSVPLGATLLLIGAALSAMVAAVIGRVPRTRPRGNEIVMYEAPRVEGARRRSVQWFAVLAVLANVASLLSYFEVQPLSMATRAPGTSSTTATPAPDSKPAESDAETAPPSSQPSPATTTTAPLYTFIPGQPLLTNDSGCLKWTTLEPGTAGIGGPLPPRPAYGVVYQCYSEQDFRGQASISFVLGRKYSQFKVKAGVVDASEYPGPYKAVITLDNDPARDPNATPLDEKEVRLNQPWDIDIQVAGAARVTITFTLTGEVEGPAPVVGVGPAEGVAAA